jgi:hypothetical protein
MRGVADDLLNLVILDMHQHTAFVPAFLANGWQYLFHMGIFLSTSTDVLRVLFAV